MSELKGDLFENDNKSTYKTGNLNLEEDSNIDNLSDRIENVDNLNEQLEQLKQINELDKNQSEAKNELSDNYLDNDNESKFINDNELNQSLNKVDNLNNELDNQLDNALDNQQNNQRQNNEFVNLNAELDSKLNFSINEKNQIKNERQDEFNQSMINENKDVSFFLKMNKTLMFEWQKSIFS